MESHRILRKRGTIIKTKSKRYQAQITINKKTHSKTFDTVAECEEWLYQTSSINTILDKWRYESIKSIEFN